MADRTERLGERLGSQVVHVRENSDHELEALFKVARNPQDSPGNLPLRMRNLPASFFKPPEPQKQQQIHSREGSTDSTGYVNSPQNGSIQPIHTRAHSSPAQLQGPLTALSPPQHARQHSCDLLDEQPLPGGWEMAKTPQGQRYFLNHMMQVTTWQDPRKANFNIANAASMNGSMSPQQALQHSPNVSMQNLQNLQNNVQVQSMPLPAGWEQAQTPEGEVYFINHVERTTSWFDPRLPMNMQRLQVRSPPQPHPVPAPVHSPAQASQQAAQMPVQQQQQRAMPSPQQHQSALQKVQLEKELLRKRQEELSRQEMALRNPAAPNAADTSSEMTTVTDPFLGQSNTPTDLHARQESADSGLGGMGSGTNFLSRTPEEFLSNVSEMDAQDSGHRQSDFTNMDMGNIEGSEHTTMDSDDLVPSLQEDISNELLNDVETVLSSNKMDNMDNLLTWL